MDEKLDSLDTKKLDYLAEKIVELAILKFNGMIENLDKILDAAIAKEKQ